MKFRPRWPLACLLLLFLVLLVRLLWTLGLSGDSWSLFADEWRQQARSLVYWQPSVSLRPPADQAVYWIQNINETQAAQRDPQVALGAAWILDTPCNSYLARHYTTSFKKNSLSDLLFIRLRREWDDATVDIMENDFELLAHEACLKQSELATSLDPENKYLWRNRALLLFQYQDIQSQPLKLVPRQNNWQAVLDECARHDPENALYDYLSAIHLWSVSSQTGPGSLQIDILDQSKYQQSHQKLSAGLQKPFLDTGYAGETAIFAFLSQNGSSLNDLVFMAGTRKGRTREQLILTELLIMLRKEFNSAADQKHYAAAAANARHNLTISKQLIVDHSYFYLTDLQLTFRLNGLVELLRLQKADPGILNPDEYEAFSKEYSQGLLQRNIHDELLKRSEEVDQPNDTPWFFRFSLLSATSLNLVFITLAGVLLAGGFSWLGTGDSDLKSARMGVWRHSICWIAGAAISLVLWGLFPAEIVPLQLQYTSLRWIYWIGYVLFILGLLFLIHAGFSVGWDELLVMVCILSLPVYIVSHFTNLYQQWFQHSATITIAIAVILLSGMLSLHYSKRLLSEKSHSYLVFFHICALVLLLSFIVVPYGFNLARVEQIPMRIRDEALYPVTWRNILGIQAIVGMQEYNFSLEDSTISRVWLVWYWLAGELFAVIISLSLLCLWYLKRQSWITPRGFSELLQNRKRITLRHAGLMLAKSCAVVALLSSLVYLASTPTFLKSSERQLLRNSRKMTDVAFEQKDTEALQAEIEADPIVMDRLRKQADKTRQWFERQPFPIQPSGEVF